jgi:hypothetical protein
MDRGMVAINDGLTALGYPSFSTQALVWLAGRVDAARLQAALTRACRAYPMLVARLAKSTTAAPTWRLRPGAACPLHVSSLNAEAPQAVLDHAAAFLSAPGDPAQGEPIRFHLLQRPNGGDVLLMQYSHVLMDNGDALPLLRAIDRLFREEDAGVNGVAPPWRDVVAGHLQRFPLARRLRAALRTLTLRFRGLRGRPMMLSDAPPHPPGFRLAIARCCVDAAETRALEKRAIRACGLPSLSMALLASVFRAVSRMTPTQGGEKLVAGLGIDLTPPEAKRPLFQTAASVVPIFVGPGEVGEWDALLRNLNGQLRERLQRDADLGTLQLASFFQTPGRPARELFARRMMRRLLLVGYSLWYAYFGSQDQLGATFCGAPIEDFQYTALTWPPMGLTLLVNRFRGRLLLQATYVPECLSAARVTELLETIRRDLMEAA